MNLFKHGRFLLHANPSPPLLFVCFPAVSFLIAAHTEQQLRKSVQQRLQLSQREQGVALYHVGELGGRNRPGMISLTLSLFHASLIHLQ